MNALNTSDFSFYQELLLKKSGLSLNEDKNYLLHSRLNPIAAKLGYEDLSGFTNDLKTKLDVKIIEDVVEAMTTNETSFFRDDKPFKVFESLLGQVMEGKQSSKKIRIWSAACSSGQEAYSLAITLREVFKSHPGWRYEIIGTDISERVLERARLGEYSQFEVQRGLSDKLARENFIQKGKNWQVNPELKSNVRFQSSNLLNSFDNLGQFDFIFCRNVLIYFNQQTKEQVLRKMANALSPGGFLFLGACETVLGLDIPLKNVPGHSGVLMHK